MKTTTTSPLAFATAPSGPSLLGEAFETLAESFEQFCLMAGIESLTQMMGEDVIRLAGDRSEHCSEQPGYRWGITKAQAGFHGSQAGFHGSKSEVERPVQIRGSEQSATPDLWRRHSHPALPNPQGAHHH
jgi:hypothetical protein